MIRGLQTYFSGITSATIDGWTYVLIAWCGAWAAALATDEAGKYISPLVLFWLRSFFSSTGACLLALKMFRSTSFADHQNAKKSEFLPPTQIPPTSNEK